MDPQKYLVIWQTGNNEQSRTETPINIKFEDRENDCAEDLVNRIKKEVCDAEAGYYEPREITLVNICKL